MEAKLQSQSEEERGHGIIRASQKAGDSRERSRLDRYKEIWKNLTFGAWQLLLQSLGEPVWKIQELRKELEGTSDLVGRKIKEEKTIPQKRGQRG